MIKKLKKKILESISYIFLIPILEKVLLRYTVGRYYGPLSTKIIPLPKLYKNSKPVLIERDGIRYQTLKSDIVDWHVYFGIKEVAKEKLYSLINEGDIVLDIGTNNADVAMKMARLTGPTGKVFGFEPHIENYNRAQKNLQLNSFSNISISNIGLGTTKESSWIKNVDEFNAGMNRISSQGDFQIEIDTLDNLVGTKLPDRIDLIKIDVEGFELRVLEGAIKYLTEHNPVLFIELDNYNLLEQSDSAKALISFLEDQRYTCFKVISGETITSESLELDNCHFDIICKKQK